jgi:glycosyltransferase involved in cell wall biosynthesis
MPEITVLVPVYKNTETLWELHQQLTSVLQEYDSFEILYVDDACPEDSLAILRQIAASDPNVGVLVMKTNQGQNRALLAGLNYARGQHIVLIDADLQDPPEAIPLLISTLNQGFAAVFAGRLGEYESQVRTFTSRLFKKALHSVTKGKVPKDAGLYVALSRNMRDELIKAEDPKPYLIELMSRTGLPLHSVPVKRRRSLPGSSGYTAAKRLRLALSALSAPLRRRWLQKRHRVAWDHHVVERIGWVVQNDTGDRHDPQSQ